VSLNTKLYQTPKPILLKLIMQWMPSSPPPLQKKSQTSLHWCYRSMARVDQLKTFLQATSQYYKYNVSIYMQEVFIYALYWQNSYSDNCCNVISLLVLSITFFQQHFIITCIFFLEGGWNIYILFVGYIHVFMAHISCCSYFW